MRESDIPNPAIRRCLSVYSHHRRLVTSTCEAAVCRKGKYSVSVPVMTVCALTAGAGAHYLPDDARSRVPGVGRDRAETSEEKTI